MNFIFKYLVLLIAATCILQQSVRAQGPEDDYTELLSIEKEIYQIVVDLRAKLKEVNVRGIDHTCVLGISSNASELNAALSHYRFSVAIWRSITNDNDKRTATRILKQQTGHIKQEMQLIRSDVNSLLGTCLKVEIAVTKGYELLALMIKADDKVSFVARIYDAGRDTNANCDGLRLSGIRPRPCLDIRSCPAAGRTLSWCGHSAASSAHSESQPANRRLP